MPSAEQEAMWEVVGGADRGGIIVRLAQDLASAQAASRLATGALVRELDLAGERLHYQLVRGAGPATGWVSIRLKEKELLVPTSKPEVAAASSAGSAEPPRPQAAATAEAQPVAETKALPPSRGPAESPLVTPGATAPPGAGTSSARVGESATPTGRVTIAAADPAEVTGRLANEIELRKACKEYGFTPGSLDDRSRASSLLQEVKAVEKSSFPAIKNEIKKRGFATPAGSDKDEYVQRLRDILLWENFRLGELRRVCRELGLEHQDVAQTREELYQLLADATWQLRGVPVWRMSSTILAFGVLDQIDTIEGRLVEDLALMCEKRGLPVEDPPEQEILADRLRAAIVWDHLPLEELRVECEARGVDWQIYDVPPAPGDKSAGFLYRGSVASDKEEQKELVRRLCDLFWQAPPAPTTSSLLPEDDPGFVDQVTKFFEVVGLPTTATLEELKKAYKDLARKHHPDKNIGSEEQVTAEFQVISEAYEALVEFIRLRDQV